MDQRKILLVMIVGVFVLFGAMVGWDMIKKKGGLTSSPTPTVWPVSDDWQAPGTTPTTPTTPPTTSLPATQILVDTYSEAIKKSGELGMPVLVFFEADWCVWCQKMKAETLTDAQVRQRMLGYIVVYVDADKERELTRKFKLTSLPAYVITNVEQIALKAGMGFQKPDEFQAWLNEPSLAKQPKKNVDEVKPDRPGLLPKGPGLVPDLRPDPDRRPLRPGRSA
jgi:thiol:disulfide interchange protein